MNIVSAKYVNDPISGNVGCIQVYTGDRYWSVPLNQDNTDYQAILEWAEEDGNEIQAAE